MFMVHISSFRHHFDVPLLILGTGHGQSASEVSCLDVLDRELGEISREIEEGHSFMIMHALEDARFKSKHQPSPIGKAGYMAQLQCLEPPSLGGPPTPSMDIVHHVRDPPHTGTTASN